MGARDKLTATEKRQKPDVLPFYQKPQKNLRRGEGGGNHLPCMSEG